MRNRMILAAAALLAAGTGFYLSRGTEAADAVRKLSGMRLALELYRQQYKRLPASFAETLGSGTLESVPALKLRRHLRSASVRDTPSLLIRDTGGWAYVNAPGDPAFGLLYIDCAHRDEKGRFWSEF